MDKNRKTRVSIPRYNHSFYICIPYLKILACTVQKNGQIKGRIKARSPILNSTIQQLIVHVYTKFNIVALKVPEKTPTQILNVHKL